ncbi:MAG: VOC family protein [Deltaproteobacteria bacterium]|nr:VOC family protein [Deltaproteobacteria bacterium]
MAKGIHHVGLAVNSVDEVASFLEEIFEAKLTDYQMETPEFFSRMVQVGQGLFELLEPRGENGLIERFLKANGEGIHHVSILIDDLDKMIEICEKKGMRVL